MFVYYEHHKDASGKIVLTELRLSSWGDGRLAINFNSTVEKAAFEMCKLGLKYAPVAQRSHDESNKVWSYFDEWGELTLQRLRDITGAVLTPIQCIEVEDLAAQAINNRISFTGKGQRLKPEDFFYNYGKPVAAPQMTKETVAQRLKQLMGDTLDKSSYRRAALKYHPDRNNGDGTKMSELHALWSVYNA